MLWYRFFIPVGYLKICLSILFILYQLYNIILLIYYYCLYLISIVDLSGIQSFMPRRNLNLLAHYKISWSVFISSSIWSNLKSIWRVSREFSKRLWDLWTHQVHFRPSPNLNKSFKRKYINDNFFVSPRKKTKNWKRISNTSVALGITQPNLFSTGAFEIKCFWMYVFI